MFLTFTNVCDIFIWARPKNNQPLSQLHKPLREPERRVSTVNLKIQKTSYDENTFWTKNVSLQQRVRCVELPKT